VRRDGGNAFRGTREARTHLNGDNEGASFLLITLQREDKQTPNFCAAHMPAFHPVPGTDKGFQSMVGGVTNFFKHINNEGRFIAENPGPEVGMNEPAGIRMDAMVFLPIIEMFSKRIRGWVFHSNMPLAAPSSSSWSQMSFILKAS
jgi:hypothetical protein